MAQPINTYFRGHWFRSRLEARWAVFLDTLGVEYRYEPEGYVLSDGTCYLPDFYLQNLDCWLEIKPVEPTESELRKLHLLSLAQGKKCYLLHGDIPRIIDGSWNYRPISLGLSYGPENITLVDGEGEDYYYSWTICPKCRRVGIEYESRADRVHGKDSTCPLYHPDNDKGRNGEDVELLLAYERAATARFEFGDGGMLDP